MQISSFFDWQYSNEYKKTATDFANALWDILSHAKNYSFEKDPLPIFYLLHAAYCDYDVEVEEDGINFCFLKPSNLTFDTNSERHKLLELFPDNCASSLYSDWEVLTEFCWMLSVSSSDEFRYDFNYEFRGAKYKYIHPFIVDFFINKFIQSHHTEYELSEVFLKQIWDVMNEYGEIGNSSDYYIPYSGLSSIALFDINNSYSCERTSYYCEENNPTLSLISKIRLCAYGHNYNIVKTSEEIESEGIIKGFSDDIFGRTTLVSIPPFNYENSDKDGTRNNFNCVNYVITKYLNNNIQTAYFVFPINFATNSIYANIRQKLVEGKLIKSIDLIPEGSFMSSSTAGILISLDKRNDSDAIKFVFDEEKYNHVPYDEIVNNDFILNPNLYFSNAKTDDSKSSYHLNRFMWKPKTIEIKDDNTENTNITSDLIHCLGPIFNRINCTIDINSDNEDFKLIKDNISYMTRVIKSFGADFSSYRTNKDEIGVNDFFQEYYSSLQNCNSSIYKIEYNSKLSDDTTFDIDEDVMRIMLDTILDNAYRHGFKKAKNIDARVGITTSCKRVKGKEFILIEVANNGLPFPNDLTFEKFISRGEFCGENGHTGLGGNHIYNIVKLHGGYLNITKSAKWNIIFDILIPIEYISDEDMDNITDYKNDEWFK